MNVTAFYRPATAGERATQIDQLISERNELLAALEKAAQTIDIARRVARQAGNHDGANLLNDVSLASWAAIDRARGA